MAAPKNSGRLLLAMAMLAGLSGCGKSDDLRPFSAVRRTDVWQAVIRDQDRSRLARLQSAWDMARADITSAGADAALAALGPVVPAAADTAELADQTQAPPPVQLPGAGSYQCRIIRLGWQQSTPHTAPPVQAGAWADCQLLAAGRLLRLETAPGPQRIFGSLYPDVDRLIFLGSVALGGEMGRLRYGEDGARDQLGVLEMVAPGQWRLALPWPRWGARLVLIELRPA